MIFITKISLAKTVQDIKIHVARYDTVMCLASGVEINLRGHEIRVSPEHVC